MRINGYAAALAAIVLVVGFLGTSSSSQAQQQPDSTQSGVSTCSPNCSNSTGWKQGSASALGTGVSYSYSPSGAIKINSYSWCNTSSFKPSHCFAWASYKKNWTQCVTGTNICGAMSWDSAARSQYNNYYANGNNINWANVAVGTGATVVYSSWNWSSPYSDHTGSFIMEVAKWIEPIGGSNPCPPSPYHCP